MAALGNDPRLAAMLVAAQGDDEIATAAKLAAILGGAASRWQQRSGAGVFAQQGNWQQRAQQLCKRLNSRGGVPDSDKIAFLLAQAFRYRIARQRGLDGRYSWQTAWGRCWTAMMR